MGGNYLLTGIVFGFLFLVSSGFIFSESFANPNTDAISGNADSNIIGDFEAFSDSGVVIGNGDVILGVGNEGHLNVPYVGNVLGLPPSDPLGIGSMGLRDGSGLYASTEPGCLCEGWGIWVPNTNGPGPSDDIYGASGVDSGGVGRNMMVESFIGNDGDDSAVSTVLIPSSESKLRVTHDYHPSPDTPYLYEVIVTVENLSEEDYDSVIYRRAMDWDIYPTPFAEYVTITGTATTTQLLHSGDNGFINVDPRFDTSYSLGAPINADFEDNGPADHGAMFDFEVGPIPAGESIEIFTFYGQAPTEADAFGALGAVKAEIFSLGQNSAPNGETIGSPATFMFAFGNVGGVVIIPVDPITELHCDVVEEETYNGVELLFDGDDLAGLSFDVDGTCAIHHGDAEPEIKDVIINVTKNIPDFIIPESSDVDLGDWTEESFGGANWEVQDMGFTVFQSVNGDPTFYYSPFNGFNTKFAGQITVETTGDDDFIGFALGFQPGDVSNPGADYLLVDWKQGNQNAFGAFAPAGLAVSKVTGIPNNTEFWGHEGSLTELARGNNLGNTGWADNTTYEFTFVFTETSLQVFVDGVLEMDIDGIFSDGRIAFYNFSQSEVRYSGFNVSPVFDETGVFTINFLDESPSITISEEGTIIAEPDGPTFGIDGEITGSDILPQCGELSFEVNTDGLEFAMVDIGSIWLMQCPDVIAVEDNNNGGSNQWDTRPTFGVSHEDRTRQVVENGFRFNSNEYMLTDNHHTDFAEQSVDIGTVNSFSATVYADKKLKIQEFLFGIPTVGEAHLAELGVEVWYDNNGNIEDVKVVQNSNVIDAETVSVSHEMTKCLANDPEPLCDTTTVSMTFLEPLMDKVMAVKAIDFKNRDQRTFLNEGFDISGESLNPMDAKLIPSNLKSKGLVQVTQMAKYSPYWTTEDGRTFEMNSFGSFKQINQSFERFEDTGNAYTRAHSGFGGIIAYEQNRALEMFDSAKLISELPESQAYIYPETGERLNEELLQEMLVQQEIAQIILDEMDRQNRHY